MTEIKHTEAFDLAYRFVTETNLNIFLTGKAGTGKTTFLKYLRANCFKKMVVAAPTGVASINAGGVTLHSLFQLPFAPFIPDNSRNTDAVDKHSLLSKIRFNKTKLDLLRSIELLVIDEASMVASHTVDAIDTILRSVRRKHQLPFGGAQVLFIGDLHQLQPVVKREEWNFLQDYYSSIFFFDSIVLKENIPVMIELKEIFRQKDNAFIEVLNEIRENNLTPDNFDLLNSRLNRNFIPDDTEGFVTLTTHNQQADRINEMKLQKLNAHSQSYHATLNGEFAEHLYPTEENLFLKEGAQVMFVKNDTETKKYFNGKTGIITKLFSDLIKVKCKGEDFEIDVKKHEWKNINYILNATTREVIEEELGSFEQYPLRLAWAITIHKSQGLTFKKVIIDAENAFANGQVYVALSRCTSLEGLVLTSSVNQRFLGAHENLKEWQEKNNDEKNLNKKFEESRQIFVQHELENIFSLQNLRHHLRHLHEILMEHKENFPVICFDWINQLTENQKALQDVADKFNDRIAQLCKENPIVEENQLLQQRIKDAANYFSNELMKWKESFRNHPLSTDTKKISKKIDAALDDINISIHEVKQKMTLCKAGFMLNEYLRHGKKLNATIENVPSSYAQSQTKIIGAHDTLHNQLYELLAELRKDIARNTDLPLFRIFSNNAINNVCNSLPASKESLLNVSGFGNATVKQYGDEVIQIVLEYCEENNFVTKEIVKKQSSRKKPSSEKKSNTLEETLKLYCEGKSISEIAAERNFTISTIEGHLAQAITNHLLNIDKIMPVAEALTIAKLFPSDVDYSKLWQMKDMFPGISYGKLKIVLAWVQSENKVGVGD